MLQDVYKQLGNQQEEEDQEAPTAAEAPEVITVALLLPVACDLCWMCSRSTPAR